jgi:hypothetical protein
MLKRSNGGLAGGIVGVGLVLGVLLGGPAIADSGGGGQASITLKDAAGVVCVHTDSVSWSLSKSGSLDSDPDSATLGLVTFEVDATRTDVNADDDSGNDVDDVLQVNGVLTVKNTGSADATIGNIVVNLQKPKPSGGWVSAAADCADATSGDGATCCNIVASASQEKANSYDYAISGKKGTFRETSGVSGSLEFTDADSNTVWAMVPQPVIPPGDYVTLKWVAKFDGSATALSGVTKVRAEIIVTFGNAGARGGSGSTAGNIDANGNGSIGSDEANVRSVPSRLTLDVPAAETCHETACLSDPESNVLLVPDPETPDVAYTDYSSEVCAEDCDPGISDSVTREITLQLSEGRGLIGNTATLDVPAETVTVSVQTGVDELGYAVYTDYDFECCPALALSASVVLPFDTSLPVEDFTTYTQGGWGATPNGSNPASLLASNFSSVYTGGVVEVGVSGSGGYSMKFTSAAAIGAYLPAGKTPGVLTADLTNPTSTSAGVFGGQVLALQLNVDFSDAGVTAGGFGDLVYSDSASSLDGKTVSEILAAANMALGGGGLPSGYTFSSLNALATNLNESFDNGVPTSWAETHLSQP